MKIGRNAPCPCGSGKKYKHCCLKTSVETEPASEEHLVWRRVRRALEDFHLRMLKFTGDVYGAVALPEAWEEFHLSTGDEDEDGAFDPDSPMLPLFLSWFFHRWTPDIGTLVEDPALHDKCPTATFLQRQGKRLEPVLRRYLEGCLTAPFSFHEVLSVESGRGFHARDVLTGDEQFVIEKSLSDHIARGDILFGQLVEVDGIVMLEATSPFALPPTDKIDIMDFRRILAAQTHLATPRERLLEFDIEIRQIYLSLVSRMLDPAPPDMHNTDGDPIELHRLVFDIDSADAAFHALKHLSVTRSAEELLDTARRDADGRVEQAEIDWSKPGNEMHAEWSNTSLGRIEISGERLIGEVNSANRAQALRQIIEDALGAQARYRATEIQNLAQALDEHREGREGHGDDEDPGDDESGFAERPEVKALLRQHMAAHYEAWVSTELPALGGQTPMRAVADPEGREKVEALLCEFERGAERMNLDASLLQGVRQRLGLE